MPEIIFYGAGKNARDYFGQWLAQRIKPVCFVDVDLNKQYTFFEHPALGQEREIPILPLLEAIKKYSDYLLYITVKNNNSIRDYLRAIGIPPTRIRTLDKRTPHLEYIPQIDYHLVEHCNLKCAHCLHFACIAEPEFTDIEEYGNDLLRLNEIIDGKLNSLNLLGGEPLLHPDIENFLKIGRKIFPHSVVLLITNGILLEKMPDSFWNCCSENNITVNVSIYPIKIDLVAIKNKAEKFGVRIIQNRQSARPSRNFDCSEIQKTNKVWAYIPLDPDGLQNIVDSFETCFQANNCTILKHGKVYNCGTAACIEHFNKKFDVNFEVSKDDYYDIYQQNANKKDMFNFLATPSPFCRFCCTTQSKLRPWGLTENKVEEYVMGTIKVEVSN